MSEALMEYLPPVIQQPPSGAAKYVGAIASGYDAKRVNDAKWTVEQAIIEGWLNDLPEGSVILDAPIGTGRFLETYARKRFDVYGLDKSPDMLNQTLMKVQQRTDGFSIKLGLGDVMRCSLPDKSVDASLNIRISRWLSPDENVVMMKEMQRVCRKAIIWTARVEGHIHSRTVELFESALDGWSITRNVEGYQPAYRILMATPNQ
jgi:ubiquinone/menaquinone biosynthesis C-methylase UbiE